MRGQMNWQVMALLIAIIFLLLLLIFIGKLGGESFEILDIIRSKKL